MSGLGDQIAVLDGLAALDPNDGRIGQQRARATQYARQVAPGVLRRTHVIDPSEGANLTGGSAYAPRMPLMPSTIGLAGLGNIPSVLPTRRNVVDPSMGANYTGGADYAPGMPLLVSSAGLADALIKGGYGRAGLGAPMIQGGYGRAGLGSTGTMVDEDLAAAAEAMELERKINPNDGRIGQRRAQVDEYGRQIAPGVLARSNVIDPSEGANYSGGSSSAPRMPLMPSTIGLAGLSATSNQIQAQRQAVLRGQKQGQKMTAAQAVAQARAAAKRLVSQISADKRRLAALRSKQDYYSRTGRGSPSQTAAVRAETQRVSDRIRQNTALLAMAARIAGAYVPAMWD